MSSAAARLQLRNEAGQCRSVIGAASGGAADGDYNSG